MLIENLFQRNMLRLLPPATIIRFANQWRISDRIVFSLNLLHTVILSDWNFFKWALSIFAFQSF
jgi:hypothetical protein